VNGGEFRALQYRSYNGSARRGFHEYERVLKNIEKEAQFEEDSVYGDFLFRTRLNYYGNMLALVHSEISEAEEELRNGRPVNENYYPDAEALAETPGYIEDVGQPDPARFKPHGVPSELADAVIRIMDMSEELGIDLYAAIIEKLEYNATRPHMHGKKF
jgi:hypothetical protein